MAFLVVYIKEAHPEDGWVLTNNREAGIRIQDPINSTERAEVANTCAVNLEVRIPVVVDGTDDATASSYGGWPDRLYLIARDGTVAYQGESGPFGFVPDQLEAAIRVEVEGAA